MRFSNCLQSKASHEAIINLHEEELHLLENIKRCIGARIKCDRDYALALNTFSVQSQKVEKAPDLGGSLVSKAWQVIVEETEALGKLMKHNADYLATYTLEMINSLIAEKRASRKLYFDERTRIDTELLMFQDAVMKMKAEYKKCLESCRTARIKFEENYLKGKASRRMDDVKDKYVKTCRKLHQTHNDYMLLLNEAAQYERDFRTVLLPDLLEFHQNVQEELSQQCKLVLMDYIQYTDLTKDRFQQMHTRMFANVEGIIPSEEYREFIEINKSAPTLPIIFVFDHDLIEDYTGRLKPNQLVVDDFTYNVLRDRMFELEERLKDCHSALNDKQELMMHFEKELEAMKSTVNVSQNMVLIKKRAIDILRREGNELRCAEEKLKKQYHIITTSLLSVGVEGLPPGVDLPSDLGCSMEQVDFNPSGRPKNIVDVLRKPFIKRPTKCIGNYEHNTSIDTKSMLVQINLGDIFGGRAKINKLMTSHIGRPLIEEEWFHGVLPREEVVRLLVNDGDFLVRETLRNEERQIVLSVCWYGHKHFIIQTTPEGFFRFEGPSFTTIQELIAFQQRNGLSVTNKSGAVLKNPIYRERWELNNDDVELITKIGRGNFGDVYKARLHSTGEEVAVKTCRITLPEEQKKKFLLEGRILKQYNHPNIVRFIGICVQKQPIMIVMELVPGGSLLNFLRTNSHALQPAQKLVMCMNAAAGMDYLESRNCIHRDLAARNCLIGSDNTVKISDFGMSREEEEYIVSDGMKQIPIKWTAPEALNFGKYTAVCDVWSFGVLMWEIYSGGNTPYNGITNAKAREMIDSGYRMPPPDDTPDEVYHLMLRCWEYNPDKRPHFAEVHANLQMFVSTLQPTAMSISDAREIDL